MAEKTTLTAVKKALEKSPKRNFRETVDLSINLKDVDLSICLLYTSDAADE